MINILYILPYDTTYKYKTAFLPSLSYQPLTLSMLAALTPAEMGAQITLVDEGVMKFDYDKAFYDIVGISVCTSSSLRGYELAGVFKKKGSYILIGGHHATLLPEEAALHADSEFINSAERTLPAFFTDYLNGAPKRFYRSDCVRADETPIPMRNLVPRKGYLKQPTVIADYGCGNSCKYCVIHSFWGSSARRSVDRVVGEIKELGAKEYLFLDPSPLTNKAYAKELFEALIPLRIHWAGLASLDIADDGELLSLMSRSGCVGMLLGYETFAQADLESMNKSKNKVNDYGRVADILHEHGISILGAFMLGFDGDTVESIRALPDLIAQAKIDVPRYAVLTPYPATPLFRSLESEGRILHRDWSKYDSVHCVFKPKNMTAGELESELLRVWKETYALERVFHRIRHAPQRKGTAFITNIGFKIYANRLGKIL